MGSFQLFTEVQHYLENGRYHPLTDCCKNRERRKAAVRRSSKCYLVKDNRLYYNFRDKLRLVVMNIEERDQVLRECHDSVSTGGHPSRRRTVERIMTSYHWASIRADANKWVDACPQCQRNDTVNMVAPGQHPAKGTCAWSVLGMDFIGPLHTTSKGRRYILTMTDLFTKWVIAKPIRNKTAAEVARKIVNVLLDFGLVDQIITNQELKFVDEVNHEIFEVFGIKHCITSTYHPQSHGQNERTKQSIKKALAKRCGGEQNDWDLHLRAAVSSINTSKQRAIKYAPYYAMFGRHPLTPGDVNATQMTGDFVVGDPVENLEERTAEIHARISENIQAAKVRQKKHFVSYKRRNVKSFETAAGDDALKAKKRKEGGKGECLESNGTGPYIVVSV